MTSLDPRHLADLEAIVGSRGLRHGNVTETLEPGIHPANLDADVVVLPASTGEVAAIVGYCAQHGIAIVPHGGRTGLAGGAVSSPGQVVVQTTRMNGIVDIDHHAGTAVVEAGATLGAIDAAVAEHGLSVGIDLAARDSATIGGMVSTNAGGIEAFRHGVTRQRVLGLEVVLPDGRVLDDLKLVSKANEGYDIKQLVIGGEGTLGIVTKVALALVPRPGAKATALVSVDSADGAVRLFRRFRHHPGGTLLASELMWPGYARAVAGANDLSGLLSFENDPGALFDVIDVADDAAGSGQAFLEEVLADAAEAEEVRDALIAKNDQERDRIWLIREDSWAIDRAKPDGFWYDVSVPQGALDRYAADVFARIAALDAGFEVFLMGHLGDGNMHLTITAGKPLPDHYDAVCDAVYEGLADIGGSFSAEHGIGLEKRAALVDHGSAVKLDMMRAVKAALDPQNIMNPGKII